MTLLIKSKSVSKSCFTCVKKRECFKPREREAYSYILKRLSCPNFLSVEEWASRILEEEKW